jgi:hypothetical protein
VRRPVCPEKYGGHQCEIDGEHDTHFCKCGLMWESVDGTTAAWAVRV